MYTCKPKGICAKKITFDIEEGTVKNISFSGGCAGNQMGMAAMAEGRPVEEVIARLEGITCGLKKTSCPDQLAKALREAQNQQ